MSKKKPERVGIYHCWDADEPKPDTLQQFKACGFADAAEQFAQMYSDMGWKVTRVGVDNDNGEQRELRVERIERFEAR